MNKEQFRKFINTITDMSKIYANIIVAGGEVEITKKRDFSEMRDFVFSTDGDFFFDRRQQQHQQQEEEC
jgi:hypothetical protein